MQSTNGPSNILQRKKLFFFTEGDWKMKKVLGNDPAETDWSNTTQAKT